MLALYLIFGPCGARYSIDRLWRLRRGNTEVPASSTANLAIRLIQVHMCIIYLFSGIAKMQGEPWVTGEASWLSFAMYRISVARHDLDGQPSLPAQLHDARHGVSGSCRTAHSSGRP